MVGAAIASSYAISSISFYAVKHTLRLNLVVFNSLICKKKKEGGGAVNSELGKGDGGSDLCSAIKIAGCKGFYQHGLSQCQVYFLCK